MLKKVSFIIAIVSLAFLIFLLARPPVQVQEIERAKINQKVIMQGTVKSERDLGGFKIISINNVEAICDCSQTYLNKTVQIIGLVEEYKSKKQLRVLEIKTP